MEYTISKTVRGSFSEVIDKVTAALKEEGFGVITSIDLKEKFREKLSVEFRNYTILGACNPKAAYEAIQHEDKIGVLLPCNVLVQEKNNGEVEVAAINPLASIGAIDNQQVTPIANEISGKLKNVIDRL